jgi:hypothetical protein
MKASRFRYSYRKNTSKLHKAVGDFLRSNNLFRFHKIYQEYPVVRVHSIYSVSSHHFDWVIPSLKMVIECHGRQHYEPVAWDGDADKSIDTFHSLQRRDNQKKKAALDAGYAYVLVPYYLQGKLTNETFGHLMDLAIRESESYNKGKEDETATLEQKKPRAARREIERKRRKEYLKSPEHKKQLRRAREHSRARYRRLKELKKQQDD